MSVEQDDAAPGGGVGVGGRIYTWLVIIGECGVSRGLRATNGDFEDAMLCVCVGVQVLMVECICSPECGVSRI